MLFCKGQESKKQEVEEEVNRRSAFVDSLVNPGESPNPAPPTANKVELAFPTKNDETKQESSGFEKQKDDSMDELKLSFLCWGSLLNNDSEPCCLLPIAFRTVIVCGQPWKNISEEFPIMHIVHQN
jgi:hypothetical protein